MQRFNFLAKTVWKVSRGLKDRYYESIELRDVNYGTLKIVIGVHYMNE